MHDIEPYDQWRHLYLASKDRQSPFYGFVNNEVYFTHSIYNHLIHPQWDDFGSQTLYVKLLYCDYEQQFGIIELFGEWNDLLYNDIMFLYRNVIESLMDQGINHFILIGEHVLNFHPDGDDYYAEWFDNLNDGWIVCLNFRDHVIYDFVQARLDYYVAFGGKFNDFNWRAYAPPQLFEQINNLIMKRLNP